MEKVTLTSLESYKAFCETEKEKERDFLAKKGEAYYYRAYRYYENYANTNEFNLLDMLIDDEDFLNFPLEVEIIENPTLVFISKETQYYFEDFKDAYKFANKLHKKGKDVSVEGLGVYYEYKDDHIYVNLNDDNAHLVKVDLIKRED